MKKLCIILLSILLLTILFPTYSLSEKQGSKSVSVGDEIIFGRYLQDINDKDPLPIEWIVLAINKNKATIISKKILELMPFHDVYEGAYWPKSSLRKWLNNDFYKTAFTKDEQRAILESSHSYYFYNNEFKQKKQNSKDRVFLLSVSETTEYFVDNGTNRNVFGFTLVPYESSNTNIAKTKGYFCAEITSYANRDHIFKKMEPMSKIIQTWWLCDSYAGKDMGSYTGSQGSLFRVEYERVMEEHGVRPVIVIDLNKIDTAALLKKQENATAIMPAPSDAAKNESTVMLGFKVNFKKNYLFSKYDVSLYVDDELICNLKHGVNKVATCRLSKGKHTVYFYKNDDHSVVTKREVTVNEHSYMVCSISTNRNGVELNKVDIISRYKIADPTILSYLKEYDAIVDQLALVYDTARYKHEKSGRTNYTDIYCLLGSKSKSALCFVVPKHVYNENPVMSGTGHYVGSISSGNVKVVIDGGETYMFSASKQEDTNERMQSFYDVCDVYILHMYPQIHGKYVSALEYFMNYDREMYELIRLN